MAQTPFHCLGRHSLMITSTSPSLQDPTFHDMDNRLITMSATNTTRIKVTFPRSQNIRADWRGANQHHQRTEYYLTSLCEYVITANPATHGIPPRRTLFFWSSFGFLIHCICFRRRKSFFCFSCSFFLRKWGGGRRSFEGEERKGEERKDTVHEGAQ